MTMKISFFPFLFVGILLCVSVDIMGQDFRSIREKVENVSKAKWPSWKLSQKIEEEKKVNYSWGSGRSGIRVMIFYGDSNHEAAELMEFKNKIISVGPGDMRTGFGDEAYSSESARGSGGQVRFRKANVYVEVTAPSLAIAEELARDIANSIKKK